MQSARNVFYLKATHKAWVLCLALSCLAACSDKQGLQFVQAGPVSQAQVDPNSAGSANKIMSAEQVSGLQSAASLKSLEKNLEAIEALRASFFNAGALLNKQNQGAQYDDLLRAYNQNLLDFARRAQSPADKAKIKTLLSEYETLVTLGCDPKYYTDCRLVGAFQNISNSVDVWLLIVDSDAKDVNQRESRIRFGRKLLNSRESVVFDLKYLAIAKDIEADLELHPDKDREEMHYNNIERILRHSDSFHASAEFSSYLQYLIGAEFDPSKASRRQQVRQFVLLSKADGNLLKQDWFIDGMRKSNEKNPFGFSSKLKTIANYGPSAISNFEIQADQKKDGIYFLIDNIFTGEWSNSTAISLWQKNASGDAQDRAELHQLIIDYVRTAFIATVVESNHRMGEFYANRKNFDSTTLAQEAYTFSHELHNKWLDTFQRIDRVRNFAIMVYGNTSPEMRSLHIDQDTLNSSVAYLVSYPYMMMMAYEMVKYRFQIDGWFHSMNYTDVITYLFEGKLEESWFDFTINGSNLMVFSPTDLLYSFHFALKTDAFRSMGINEEDFVNTMTVELIKGIRGGANDMETWGILDVQRLWELPRLAYAAEWDTLQQMCKEEKQVDSLSKADAQGFARSYAIDIPAEKSIYGLIPESSVGNKAFSNAVMSNMGLGARHDNPKTDPLTHQLRYVASTYSEGLENLRARLGERLKFIGDMLEIYRKHLSVTDTAPGADARIAGKLASASAELARVQLELKKIYTTVFDVLRSYIIPCLPYIMRKEFDFQNQIIRYEYVFYKQVFRDYQKLRALIPEAELGNDVFKSQDPKVQAIVAKYIVHGFDADNYTGFDKFNFKLGVFEGHRLDAVMRFKRYLEVGLTTDEGTLPPINPSLHIIFPNVGLKDMDMFSSPMIFQMSFQSATTPDDFAAKNIKSMASYDSMDHGDRFSLFHARADFYVSDLARDYLQLFLVLLKTGAVDAYADAHAHCGDNADKQSPACAVTQASLTEDEFVNAMYTVYELYSGNDDDLKIFQLLGINSRGALKHYALGTDDGHSYWIDWGSEYLFNPFTRERLGFFDYSYLTIANVSVGWGKVLPWSFVSTPQQLKDAQLTVLEKGKQLYKIASSEGLKLFSMDPEISEYLRKAYAERIRVHFAGPKLVEKFARDSEAADNARGFKRRYHISNRSGPWAEGFYLDQRIVTDQETAESDYNRFTRGLFDPSGNKFSQQSDSAAALK